MVVYDEILQVRGKDIEIGDIINDDVLNRLNEEFGDCTIQPVQIVFSVEKEETVEGRMILAHVKQEHVKEKICTFDVDDPKLLDKFVKSIKGDNK